MIERWLVFDIGTTSTKAAIIGHDGAVVRSATSGYETRHEDGGIVEQDAGDWWQAVTATTHSLNDNDRIEAIVLTGQMQDVVLLDNMGNPVRPVILYSDTRAHTEIQQVIGMLGADRLRDLTGNDQDAGSLLAKLLWLVTHEPGSLASAQHLVFGAGEYVAGKMSGRYVSDSTTASTTGLLNLRTRKILDPMLLQQVGLASLSSMMPEVVAGGTQIGLLSTDAAAELGLQAGLPVFLAPGDAGCATIGAGSGEIGGAYAYVGTSGWVAFTGNQSAEPGTGVITLAHPRPTHYIQVAPMMTAGGNLEWIRELFERDDYDSLIDSGLQRPPSRLLYLPYLNGERAPFSDPFVRGGFVGLNGQTTRADLYRATLEGVAFAYRHMLDTLLPQPPDRLTMTGGGSQSLAFCQLFADILNVTVAVAEDAENAGLHGAIRAAQVANRQETTYQISHIAPAHSLQPASNRAGYDAKYRLFRELYPALKTIFEELVTIAL